MINKKIIQIKELIKNIYFASKTRANIPAANGAEAKQKKFKIKKE
jgi:hypothetical protein